MFNRYTPRYYLFLIISFSILFKLVIFMVLYYLGADFTLPDSPSYFTPAQRLLNQPISLFTHGLWERTPLYLLFIAGIYKIFGQHLQAVVIVQIFLSGFLVFNAYRITKLLSNQKAGLYAALIVAIDYLLISYTSLVMTDVLFAILFSYIFYYSLYTFKAELNLRLILLIGLLLALCTLIRPISYYLIPLSAVSLFFYSYKKINLTKAILNTVILLIPCLLLLGSWQYRNKQVVGTYQLTNIDAVNLYHYYAADVLAHVQHQPIEQVQQQLAIQANAQHFNTPLERYNYYRHEGIKILLAHPILSIKRGVAGLLRTLFGNDYILLYYNYSQFQHGKQLEQSLYQRNLTQFYHEASITDLLKMGMIVAFFIFNALLVLAALYYMGCCIYNRTEQRQYIYILLIIIGYFCLVSSNYCSLARFRIPFQIIIDSCGALGLLQFVQIRQKSRRRFFTKDNILTP